MDPSAREEIVENVDHRLSIPILIFLVPEHYVFDLWAVAL
jgi:hypothetical protein